MKTTIVSAVAVAILLNAVSAQIPPNFSPSSSKELLVSFNSSAPYQPGSRLGIDVPAMMPHVGFNSLDEVSTDQTYTVMMTDPDAPTPQNPNSSDILHWLAPNMQLGPSSNTSGSPLGYTLMNSTPNAVPFARSMPPVTSAAHRYMQWLFIQPPNFVIPEAFSGYSASNRSLFNLTEFLAAAGLGSPVAANYFLCSNGTDAVAPYAVVPPANGTMISNGTMMSNSTPTSTYPPVATQTTNSASVMGMSGGILGLAGLLAAAAFW